jgi:hypothetical protein
MTGSELPWFDDVCLRQLRIWPLLRPLPDRIAARPETNGEAIEVPVSVS